MLLYQLGHQPHFIISSTWTLISQTWPQWKMRCLPQHGCVHQPAGLAEQHSRALWFVLAVNGLHTSVNLWTIQQPRTKVLSVKVYDTPCWRLCATAASAFSALPFTECWWEADPAGVSGGLKSGPLYCSGTLTLWWACVKVKGEWSFNVMLVFLHGWFSISGYAPALR